MYGAVYGAVEVGAAEASEGVAGARPGARSVGQAVCRAWRRRLHSMLHRTPRDVSVFWTLAAR